MTCHHIYTYSLTFQLFGAQYLNILFVRINVLKAPDINQIAFQTAGSIVRMTPPSLYDNKLLCFDIAITFKLINNNIKNKYPHYATTTRCQPLRFLSRITLYNNIHNTYLLDKFKNFKCYLSLLFVHYRYTVYTIYSVVGSIGR